MSNSESKSNGRRKPANKPKANGKIMTPLQYIAALITGALVYLMFVVLLSF